MSAGTLLVKPEIVETSAATGLVHPHPNNGGNEDTVSYTIRDPVSN